MSTLAPAGQAVPPMTLRSVIAGFVLAIVMCGMNSYLTLSFGVIEEGPTIAALFFFAFFFLSKTKITTTEMVTVATMGSAGGSFGFIANFYAAKALVGEPYSIAQMIGFGIVSSMVGLAAVVPLRELLIRKANLPWPGSKATESVIRSLVEHGDPKQPLYLAASFLVLAFYVVCNKEDGVGWFPAEIHLLTISGVGIALSLAPFAIGGSYLMGMRTCVGFLVGAGILIAFAATGVAPNPDAPNHFYWPGIGFLTASGLTLIGVNWRVMSASFRSLVSFRQSGADDPDRIMSGRTFAIYSGLAFVAALVVLVALFDVPAHLVLVLVAIGGLLQNIIATRAQAQTAFNPARVMGILLEGVCWLFGGRSAGVNLTGAGFVAGSGAQAGNLTGDMAYGAKFKVPPKWQFIVQASTIIPCAVVAAVVFHLIVESGKELNAPIAKMWGAAALIFEGKSPLPPGAQTWLLIGAAVGVVYTLVESIPRVTRWIPCSVGLGLGLVLHPSLGIAFFVGGFLFWIILARGFKVKDVTLTTIAVGAIVAEGIGGVLKPILHMAGLF